MRTKIFMLAILVCLGLANSTYADNDRLIRFEELPKQAQKFVTDNFSTEKITYVKMDRELMDRSYEIMFVNGAKIDFNGRGEWKEIDCRYDAVPNTAVPAAILQYVNSKFPDVSIVEIDRDHREYEVKLSNKLELTFDKNFNLIDMDR